MIGAPGVDGGRGTVYVFARSGKTWQHQATLAGPSSGSPYDSNDDFGYAVALSATTAVVSTNQDDPNLGAPIYVFARSGKTWHRQAILDDPDGG